MDLSELGCHFPVSSKAGNYPDEHAAETLHKDEGGHNISSSLKKKSKHTQWVSATIRVKSNKGCLTSIDLKAKVVRLGDGW